MYYVYKLTFYGTDKFYIGCTRNTGKRMEQHKEAEKWLDEMIMPKKMEILLETSELFVASFKEYKWICLTWEDNLNKKKEGYPIYTFKEGQDQKVSKDQMLQDWYDSVEGMVDYHNKLHILHSPVIKN